MPDTSADRCTDTTPVAPAAAAASYAAANVSGAGRDVETGSNERKASATMRCEASGPSSSVWAPTTTCRGTTTMSC